MICSRIIYVIYVIFIQKLFIQGALTLMNNFTIDSILFDLLFSTFSELCDLWLLAEKNIYYFKI